MRLGEQPGKPPEVPLPAGAESGLQFGWVAPPGDQVWVAVLLAAAGPIQVPDEACGPLAAEHLPDHRSRLRTASATASSRSARRAHSAA